MKLWRVAIALPTALIASQALADHWADVGTTGTKAWSVNQNSIRHRSDGLIAFTAASIDSAIDDDLGDYWEEAADCQKRVIYTVARAGEDEYPGWRNNGVVATPGSINESLLKYVCANAG